MSKKSFETGRSMVEMLGVLAVIGILSVAGIYGYTTAMRKYKANEIVHTASALAIAASSMDNGAGGCKELSSSDLPKNPGGADVEIVADVDESRTNVCITFKNGDDSLCTFIEDMAPYDCGVCLLESCQE